MPRITAIIAAAFVVAVATLALRPAAAQGEPPRPDDAHPPLALWYGGIPPRYIVLGYQPFFVGRAVHGRGFYHRRVSSSRYRY